MRDRSSGDPTTAPKCGRGRPCSTTGKAKSCAARKLRTVSSSREGATNGEADSTAWDMTTTLGAPELLILTDRTVSALRPIDDPFRQRAPPRLERARNGRDDVGARQSHREHRGFESQKHRHRHEDQPRRRTHRHADSPQREEASGANPDEPRIGHRHERHARNDDRRAARRWRSARRTPDRARYG